MNVKNFNRASKLSQSIDVDLQHQGDLPTQLSSYGGKDLEIQGKQNQPSKGANKSIVMNDSVHIKTGTRTSNASAMDGSQIITDDDDMVKHIQSTNEVSNDYLSE